MHPCVSRCPVVPVDTPTYVPSWISPCENPVLGSCDQRMDQALLTLLIYSGLQRLSNLTLLAQKMAHAGCMADKISSWIIGGRHEHAMSYPPTLLNRHPFTGVILNRDLQAPSTTGSSPVLRGHSLVPRMSLLDEALLSRYPAVKDFPTPSFYWQAAADLQKRLPHKVSRDVKHQFHRSSTIVVPTVSTTRTDVTPAERLRTVSDDNMDTNHKRTGRRCKMEGCLNSVVQGGLCISHGAKRKQCAHPGCTKNVKKAGMCSAHGPARKKCEHPDCCNIAVQGGLCIAHGAKKRLCSHGGCTKKARSAWNQMCKRHYDEKNQRISNQQSTIVPALLALGGGVSPSMIADTTHCYPVLTRGGV